MYIISEKTYFDRLGKRIDDEINIHDSDNIDGLIKYLEKQNIKITKRAIFYAIKNKTPIANKYNIYKIKVK